MYDAKIIFGDHARTVRKVKISLEILKEVHVSIKEEGASIKKKPLPQTKPTKNIISIRR